MIERVFSYTPEKRLSALAGHCEVAQMLASRLGFSGGVSRGLAFVFERWDGGGAPNGIRGVDQPLRCSGSGNATRGETTIRPFGWMVTDGFLARPRSRVSNVARLVSWRPSINTY